MSEDLEKAYQKLRGVYRACFYGADGNAHPAGVQVLRDLRTLTTYGSSPFRNDLASMAYEVGKQDVMRHLLKMLDISDAEIGRLVSMIPQQETSSEPRWGE